MKSFTLRFAIYSILMMGLTYGFVVAVDPYDKLGINLFGFETKAVASSRENKFYMLDKAQDNYEAFIMGSSTAHRYETDVLKKISGLETFNYAVQHTTPEDYIAITNHILSKFNPKLIVLQVAFVDLDGNYETDKRLYTSPLKEYLDGAKDKVTPGNTYISTDLFSNQYLTLSALVDSFRVVGVNLFGEIRHQYAAHGDYKNEAPPKSDTVKLVQAGHTNYKISTQRVEQLKKIQKICDDKGIKLIAISAPIAPVHLDLILNDAHVKSQFDQYKKAIRGIFTNLYDFTTDDVRNYNSTKYFRNSTHPSKLYSRMILEQIWSQL